MQAATDFTTLKINDYRHLLSRHASQLWRTAWALSAIDVCGRFVPAIIVLKAAERIRRNTLVPLAFT